VAPQASGGCRLITDDCDKDECRPIDQGVARFRGFAFRGVAWGRQRRTMTDWIYFKPEPVKACGFQEDEMQMPARAIIRVPVKASTI
jgi:hypothetical protein